MSTEAQIQELQQERDAALERARIAEAVREPLYGAVRYLLDRLQEDADLGYVAGPGTEAFRRLCLAEAAVLNRKPKTIEARRRVQRWATLPRVLDLQRQLAEVIG